MSRRRSEFRMKPMYDVLLGGTPELRLGLYQLYKLTPAQLCRLHYSPGSLKAIYARLKELAKQGYVQVHSYAVDYQKADGKTAYAARDYYMLTTQSVRYLADQGFDINPEWRPYGHDDKNGHHVIHTLEVNDVIIAAGMLQGVDPRFYLNSFRHERDYLKQPYPVTLRDGRTVKLSPDAYLDFRRTDSKRSFPVLLEHDRDSEYELAFKHKIQKYVAFIEARGYERAFSTDRINVAFTTFAGDKRLQDMRQYTREVLQDDHVDQAIWLAFRFATFPEPLDPRTAWLEPHWHYAFDGQPPQPLLAA